MKVAIIGTRGIPNNHGGFEQFAEYLSVGLVKSGYAVTVYNSHTHPYNQNNWKGVNIIYCYNPEDKIGTAGQFIYDLNCIMNSRHQNFDIILMLGYTSSSIWGSLLPRKHTVITTNMDGLEWKRGKYSNKVQSFLKFAEMLGVRFSDYLISDSIGIQDYLRCKYNRESVYIPYGAHEFNNPDESILQRYILKPYQYDLMISRLEPENSIEMILDGKIKSGTERPFVVVGKSNTKYGSHLLQKYKAYSCINFIGGVYDIQFLNNLRYFSNLYFHGHTVGGTNPSLIEAMASGALICAHKNIFNESILNDDAYYFKDAEDVKQILAQKEKIPFRANKINNNLSKVRKDYHWDNIIGQYKQHFEEIYQKKKLQKVVMQ